MVTFDYVIGNPPYEDTSSQGSNKKLWKDITRKVQGLTRNQIIFVTPKAQDQYLLYKHTFYLDYTADDYFNVGTKIIAWGMQMEPMLSDKERTTYSSNGVIDNKWNNSPERKILQEFNNLKNTPVEDKLFKRQSCEPGPLEVIKNASKNTFDTCTSYVIPDGHKILAISTSKSLKRENILIGYKHYGSLYAQIDITNWSEKETEQFIQKMLQPSFVDYCNKFRKYYGTGFNNVLLYTDSLERKIKFVINN